MLVGKLTEQGLLDRRLPSSTDGRPVLLEVPLLEVTATPARNRRGRSLPNRGQLLW